jgi:putative transposase
MRTLKREEIYANTYRDLEDLRAHIEEFIERYYNRIRLHSALGYLPPEEFEQAASGQANGCGAASMSFSGMGKSIHPMCAEKPGAI